MSDNNKKNNVRVIKSLLSLVIFLICFLSTGCCFANDKTYCVFKSSDVELYRVARIESSNSKTIHYGSCIKLNDGRVLITGGLARNKRDSMALPTKETHIYDPKTNKIVKGPDMYYGRQYHSSLLLPDGRVFIYGVTFGSNPVQFSTEIYDPDFNTFIPGPDLIKNIFQKRAPLYRAYFLDDKKEYLYVITDCCTNLLDLKNNKMYAFDPIRPHKLADEINSEYKCQTEGTDTIIGFENKTLEKDLVKRMK